MRRNLIETVMGAVVIVVAIGFLIMAFQSTSTGGPSGYEVTVEFTDVTGISVGSDVRMAGVKVGTVTRQELDPETFLAVVTLSIDEEIQLPEDSSARILLNGLLGGSFVGLEPGGAEESIPPGGAIEYAQGSVNLMDLLGRFIFSAGEEEGEGGTDADGSPALPQ